MPMKDETIRPGDLVEIAYPELCCGKVRPRITYYVSKIVNENCWYEVCDSCHTVRGWTTLEIEVGSDSGCNIKMLRKIHPPELPETVDAGQEVEA